MPTRCSATSEQTLRGQFKENYVGCFITSGTETVPRTEVLPSRSVVLLKTNTPLSADQLPPGLLSTMAICRIKGDFDEETLYDRLKSPEVVALLKDMRTRTGASVENLLLKDHPSEQKGQDSMSWRPSLSADSYPSISSHDIGRYDKEFSLVLFTGNPTLENELRTYANEKAHQAVRDPYTVGRFVSSLRYNKAIQLANRNIEMAMAELSVAMGIELDLQEDLQAVRVHPSQIGNLNPALLAKSGRANVARCDGVSLYNHLFAVEFQTAEGPRHDCVAIYTDCGNLASGRGQPVFPISPLDGVATIPGFQVAGHPLPPTYSESDLLHTLPCGAPFSAGTPNLTTNESRYVARCLSTNIGASVGPSHAKINRVYMNREAFVKPLVELFAESELSVRILRHVVSTV